MNNNVFAPPLPTCDLCQKSIHGTAHQPRGSMDRYHIACWQELMDPAPPPPRPLPPPVRVAPPSPEPAPLMPAPLPPEGHKNQPGRRPRRSPPPPLAPPSPRPKPPTLADRVVEALQICPLDGGMLRVALGTRPPPTSIKPGFGYQQTNGWYHLPGQAIPEMPPRKNAPTIDEAIQWLDGKDESGWCWRATTVRELADHLGISRAPAAQILDQIGEELKKRQGQAVRYRLKPSLRGRR